jgi:hypothetical protein
MTVFGDDRRPYDANDDPNQAVEQPAAQEPRVSKSARRGSVAWAFLAAVVFAYLLAGIFMGWYVRSVHSYGGFALLFWRLVGIFCGLVLALSVGFFFRPRLRWYIILSFFLLLGWLAWHV